MSAEGAALEAAIDDDRDRANELIQGFWTDELRSLRQSLARLDAWIAAELGDRP